MSATPDTASTYDMAAKVFAVPELLENILLQLDDRDPSDSTDFSDGIPELSKLQRVNKTFKAAIDSSVKLQRMMLLRHDPDAAAKRAFGLEYLLAGPLGYDRFHPAIPCIDKHPFDTTKCRIECVTFDYYHEDAEDEEENRENIACGSCASYRVDTLEVHEAAKVLTRAALKGFFCHEASWRRMKLSAQPEEIKLYLYTRTPETRSGGGSSPYVAFLAPTSTLGELWNVIQDFMLRTEDEADALHVEVSSLRDLVMAPVRGYKWHGKAEALRVHRDSIEHLQWEKEEHDKIGVCRRAHAQCDFCSATEPYLELLVDFMKDL